MSMCQFALHELIEPGQYDVRHYSGGGQADGDPAVRVGTMLGRVRRPCHSGVETSVPWQRTLNVFAVGDHGQFTHPWQARSQSSEPYI